MSALYATAPSKGYSIQGFLIQHFFLPLTLHFKLGISYFQDSKSFNGVDHLLLDKTKFYFFC